MDLLMKKIEIDENGNLSIPSRGKPEPALLRRRARSVGRSIQEEEFDEILAARIFETEIQWSELSREKDSKGANDE